ncbi:MAG: magnesium protoporphyrin IX methyltransferase [Pseudomonadota bacterium]|nr:magnesium protoporphyrin IX methyltransferase [Pseudomonadota bacterium]
MSDVMTSEAITYEARRAEIETYFDRTAAETWKKLTSTAPVGRIRQTVRAGRDTMRATLLSWLPEDLTGRRILDAGCGTGAFAVEAAARGADIVAIDLSETLVTHARTAAESLSLKGQVTFRSGDMLDEGLGRFDHVVAMDSLIHYEPADSVAALARLSARTECSILFTFAPKTPLLTVMHAAGRFFPRGDRAPAIVPVSRRGLIRRIEAEAPIAERFAPGRGLRVDTGFYKSHAMELAAR